MKSFLLSLASLLMLPFAAATTPVTSPVNGAHITSPFQVVASLATCHGNAVHAMGLSLDSKEDMKIVQADKLNVMVTASLGKHVVHVKAWHEDEVCVTDVSVVVVASNTPPPPITPTITWVDPAAITFGTPLSATQLDATTTVAGSFAYSPALGTVLQEGTQVLDTTFTPTDTVHYKATTASVDIVVNAVPTGPVVPANAIVNSDIQTLGAPPWHWNHDKGTPGTADGDMTMVSSPSVDGGSTAKFVSTFTDNGGEIYSVTYADDEVSTNFVYDAWLWFETGSNVGNMEMDSNQVLADGNTVIYAFQCAGDSKTWDYSGAGAKWVHSTQYCDPTTWATDTWHHVQISYQRDAAGKNVTYNAVWLDGVEAPINATVPSSFPLGWRKGVVQTQFQMDGAGASGGSTVYLGKLTISRW